MHITYADHIDSIEKILVVTLYQSYSLDKSNSSADDNISNRPGNICKESFF